MEKLSGLKKSRFDTPEITAAKLKKAEYYYRHERCYPTSHCAGDANPLKWGAQTLFVNAAIKGTEEDHPMQLPWLIDIELPRAG